MLTFVVPPDLVDEAVGDGLAWEMRLRALPARLGVYFVLGLCLFSAKPYPDVIREVTAGLQAGLAAAGWRDAGGDGADQGARPDRGDAAAVAAAAAVLGAVAGTVTVVTHRRAAGRGGGRDHHQHV